MNSGEIDTGGAGCSARAIAFGRFDDICRLPTPVSPTYHFGMTAGERTCSRPLIPGCLWREACWNSRKWRWDELVRDLKISIQRSLNGGLSALNPARFADGMGKFGKNGIRWGKFHPVSPTSSLSSCAPCDPVPPCLTQFGLPIGKPFTQTR